MEAALPVKMTLFRLLQESLANGFRHAGGIDQRVTFSHVGSELIVEVGDGGPGFDASEARIAGRVGLAGMRERLSLLSGELEIESSIGAGTTIFARIPFKSERVTV